MAFFSMHWMVSLATDPHLSRLSYWTLSLLLLQPMTQILTRRKRVTMTKKRFPVHQEKRWNLVKKCTHTGAEMEPEQPSTSKNPISMGKRKHSKEDKIEFIMSFVVKEVVTAQRESDKIFLAHEEKRMKFETERRQSERYFQFRMMSMLFGPQSRGAPPPNIVRHHHSQTSMEDPIIHFQIRNSSETPRLLFLSLTLLLIINLTL